MTCALLILAVWLPLSFIAGVVIGHWLNSNATRFPILDSNSIEATDLPIVDPEEFPINSGA